MHSRESVVRDEYDKRQDDDDINLLPDETKTYTNLASERDDDNTTISTHRYDDSKSVQELTGKSFRDKCEKMRFGDVNDN